MIDGRYEIIDIEIYQISVAIYDLFRNTSRGAGCGLGAWGMRYREMAQVGIGMVPRGEVGIVVAQIGLGLGVITQPFFASVLFMAVATTLIAPPFIKIFFAEDKDGDGIPDEMPDVDISEEFSRIG